MLISTHDADVFCASPLGRCLVGPSFAIWCAAPDLQGSIIWGTLDESTIRDMFAVSRFITHPTIGPRRRTISDLGSVERADADVLLGFVAAARERALAVARGIERQALIVPDGPGGILLAGPLPMLGVDHALRVSSDLESAIAFVEHPLAQPAHASATAAITAARGQAVLVSRLRQHLGRDPSAATIVTSASALGMSTRTLQRELQRLDTSFSDELRRVRIATAEALLVHTDLKIEAIATRVGFGTASRMSACLRRELNVTASQLRAERRVT